MKRAIITLIIVVSLLAGCTKSDPATDAAVPSLSSADVEKLITDNRGKVLILNIFATWCPPCEEETPGFVRFYTANGNDNFEMVGLSIDKSKADVIKFKDRFGINYPVYHITPSVQRKLMADKVPTSHIYTPDGEYYTTVLGSIDENTLARLVEQLGE